MTAPDLRAATRMPANASMPAGGRDLPQRVAVLVPCFNEEAAIAQVVRDFREGREGLPFGPSNGQPRSVRLFRFRVQGNLHGHSFRLSRVLPAFRQVLPGALTGL